MMPIVMLIPTERMTLLRVTIVGMPAKRVMSHGMNMPTPIPIRPPTVERTMVSIRN